MARYNLRDVIQAISIVNTAQGAYLTTDGSAYEQFPSDANPPVLPTRTPIEDNAVGDGRAYPKQSKPYYFNPINYPYSMALNSTMGVRLLRMFLGGTISSVVNAVPLTTDWTIQQKGPGDTPMLANLLRKLGGEGFVYGDSFVQTIEVSQQGAQEPRISAQFNNNGHHVQLSSTAIDVNDIDSLATYSRMHGVKTKLSFSDGVGSYDFASEGRLIDVGFTGSQNVIVDQLPGDSFVYAASPCHGAMSDNFYIDIQTGEIRGKVFMDASFAQFASWLPNRKLTSVKLLFAGCEIIGASTHNFEIEIIFPIAEFNLEPDQQANFSAYSFMIRAIEGDVATGSLIQARIRRLTADGVLL